ncbi:hypothetical protein NM22_10345 [Vibrio tubiashii]|nr:hypothetical protein NM22_10345 [Vibrio tubiashii]
MMRYSKLARCRAKKNQSGLAAVEFVISAPILIFIFMAIVELASALIEYNTMAKMVQNGVRHATVELLGTSSSNPCSQSSVVSSTKDIVVYGQIIASGSTASPILDSIGKEKVSVTCSSSYITVTITHEYAPQITAFVSDFDFSVPLVTSAMMRY